MLRRRLKRPQAELKSKAVSKCVKDCLLTSTFFLCALAFCCYRYYYFCCYYYYYYQYYHYYYYDKFMKYLALKTRQLNQVSKPYALRGLNQVENQPYSVCCLTGQIFRGVQRSDVNNMKMMPRNNSSPFRRTYPIFCVGCKASAKHNRIHKYFPYLYLLIGISTETANRVNELGASAIQNTKI